MTSTISNSLEDNKIEQQDTIAAILPEENKKICADCKYLIGVRTYIDIAKEKWRCGHEKNENGWADDLVTGIKIKIFMQPDIYVVRYGDCNGDWWEEYIKPTPVYDPQFTARDIDSISSPGSGIRRVPKRKLTDDDLNNL